MDRERESDRVREGERGTKVTSLEGTYTTRQLGISPGFFALVILSDITQTVNGVNTEHSASGQICRVTTLNYMCYIALNALRQYCDDYIRGHGEFQIQFFVLSELGAV